MSYDWKNEVRERLNGLRLEATREAGFIEELSQHLEDRFQALQDQGLSQEDAYASTLRELDNTALLNEVLHRRDHLPKHDPVVKAGAPTGNLFVDLIRDLRFAFRSLRKSPGFTFFVVATLALGIGANTTVFTVINALILNPLPVERPSRIASLSAVETKDSSRSGSLLPLSYLNLKDFQTRNQVFSDLAGYTSPMPLTWASGGGPTRLFGELVTANYFEMLGLKAARGRFFLPEEDSTPGGHPVAVMNYATWQGRFGGAADIVGRTLRINNVVFTVIGIAPKGFIGVNAIFGPDLWMPATMAEQVSPKQLQGALSERAKAAFYGVARLRSEVGLAQAQANIANIASALQKEYPDTNETQTVAVRPISEALFATGWTQIRMGSAVLLAIVGLVLLIACSNVANLLLARSAARKQEIAVRLAMGARRGRLIRQLLTESVLLALISGLVGLAIGYEGCQLLWSFLPAEVSANLFHLKLDTGVLVFTLAVSLATGLIFGMVPAIRASRADVVEALKEETRTAGRSRRAVTFGNALLVAQVAFSFVSLVTAVLCLRSIERAYAINPGFDAGRLAIFLASPGQAGYGVAQTKQFYEDVRDRVAALPGVASVSWASNLPLWNGVLTGLRIEGRQERKKSDTISSVVNTVDVNYFETTGIEIVRGREFREGDKDGAAPVAIVNETMARKYWPNSDATGKRIRLPGESFYRQIVGIARRADYTALAEAPQSCVYVPLRQNFRDAMTLFVRTKGDPQQILTTVQREVRAVGPQVEVNDIRTGSKIIDQALTQAKMAVALLSVFGLLALGLASIGLYGIMAYSVNRRTREIGVRMALGAAQSGVLRLILRQGMTVVGTGILIGLSASLLVGRVISRLLYGMSASDPISIALAVLVLSVVALVACYLPARRASQIDPIEALREA